MFWEILVELCKNKGTTPTTVIRELGFSTGSVSHWKKGKVPHASTIKKLSEYFGVPVSYFFTGTDEVEKRNQQIVDDFWNGKNPSVRIPVYGNVAAGIPIEAITDIDDWEEISDEMAQSGSYVALRIHGDSMEPKMSEGDVVIVRLQETLESGETGIIFVNGGEATCKKIKRTPEGIMLLSTNPKYEPMFYSNEEISSVPIRIFGKVVELRAKF